MRRRTLAGPPPPAELLEYDEALWLPHVDPAGYDPDHYRNRTPDGPYGPPRYTSEAWRRGRARGLWLRARIAWAREHGWPGGLTGLDLLREGAGLRGSGGPLCGGSATGKGRPPADNPTLTESTGPGV